ncbi:glycosyltransferase family 4 protein [Paenibacillus sp. HB172176]|uniref:glycosyltransferase family 4 protein n=1 Tax=Paenibacillus sp. HB172176 TaxID=2493690 RepID=UPI001438BB7D|nr:glycosyltransferase family 4 protein [Paenibacillus sp. HB172176]
MKMLIACSDFPYPADHGGRVDTWGRIKVLSELGWQIDLVVCGKTTPTAEEKEVVLRYVADIRLCDRRSRILDLLHPDPLQVRSRTALRHVKLNGPYDYVLLEGDYVYPILDNPEVRSDMAILRVHNDESIYFKALARSSSHPLHKLYYTIESGKFVRHERKLRSRIDKHLFISNKEFEKFRMGNETASSRFLPPPVTSGSFRSNSFASKQVVFIGSLFMPNNREGIEWYLTHVHEKLLENPEYSFVIAGNSRGGSLDWLKRYNLSRVVVHDSPESLDGIYEQGCLFVNPMQNGAGVKLKTIEAIQNGLPVVSTSVGSEGTGLLHKEHIMIADDPQKFCSSIQQLLDSKADSEALLRASQQFIAEHYNHKEVLRSFFQSLNPDLMLKGRAANA